MTYAKLYIQGWQSFLDKGSVDSVCKNKVFKCLTQDVHIFMPVPAQYDDIISHRNFAKFDTKLKQQQNVRPL